MENNMLLNSPQREISVVTAEIKELKRQAQSMALFYVIEIGRRLVEAKSVLPHGEWSGWLKEEVEFSQSSANNFMRLFEEYGDRQISLFGAVSNSQSIANLPYTKALKLLAIPSEERESFAEAVGAESISVKELEEAIRERNEAQKRAKEEKERADQIEERLSGLEEAESRALEAEKEAQELEKKLLDAEKSLASAEKASREAKEKLDAAMKNPKIPSAEIQKIRKEAADAAKTELERKMKLEMDGVRERAAKAESAVFAAKAEADVARRELEEARKQLKTANPAIIAFKTLFDDVQSDIIKLKEMIERVRSADAESAVKLEAALQALSQRL